MTWPAGEGLITYMRTDGLQMSAEAVQEIRTTVQDMLGPEYLPAQPRTYKWVTTLVLLCRQQHHVMLNHLQGTDNAFNN